MSTKKIKAGAVANYYPVVISNDKHQKLLAIQTIPTLVFWFKDKEVSLEAFQTLLQSIPSP